MEKRELESEPVLPALYARAVAVSLMPRGDELPERELVLRRVELDRDRIATYTRVCGFGLRDTVPGTFPHVLAFPLHLALMTERTFPFSVLGLVHIANRIEVLAPIPVGAALELTLRAEGLRPHRRGRQFELVAAGRRDGQTVWRGRSTYLHRGEDGADSTRPRGPGREPDERRAGLETTAVWTLPGDLGRRYASVSGDRNPIHMHSLSARALGFPGAIAHGMWTKARCLAAFEGRLPDSYAIEIEFEAPLRIPGRARFRSGREADGWRFAVERPDGERSHAAGSIAARR